MIFNAVIKGGSGGGDSGLIKFAYTGSCIIENNVLRLLDSGAFVPLSGDVIVDLFLVGGGGGGGNGYYTSVSSGNKFYVGGGGGGGGYTASYSDVMLTVNMPWNVAVGSGGASGSDGGNTSFGDTFSASGGKAGTTPTSNTSGGKGGAGGSGGGDGGSIKYDDEDREYSMQYGAGGAGGSDGADGYYKPPAMGTPTIPTGQGTTTRAFGDPSGELFSTGGTGGALNTSDRNHDGDDGVANTGDGGGGGVGNGYLGGKGGSGIVLIRFPEGAELARVA